MRRMRCTGWMIALGLIAAPVVAQDLRPAFDPARMGGKQKPVLNLHAALSLPAQPENLPIDSKVALVPAPVVSSFQAQHPLLGRISNNIQRAGLTVPDVDLPEPESFTISRNRGVLRAARKAVKGFLIDDLELYRHESRDTRAPEGGVARPVQFHVGFSHLAPRVDLRVPSLTGSLNFSLSARGNAGIDFSTAAAASSAIHLGYDYRSKTTGVSYRIAF